MTVDALAAALRYPSSGGLSPGDLLYDCLDACGDLLILIPANRFTYLDRPRFVDHLLILRDPPQKVLDIIFHESGETRGPLSNHIPGLADAEVVMVEHPKARPSSEQTMIMFVHHSVREFLMQIPRSGKPCSPFRVDEAQYHLTVACRALDYMALSILRQDYVAFHISFVQERAPFLLYASLY